jgi:NAD(P)H-dependent flavin oxidoreductase YrpB (nitropropane dioxygenase family)
MIDVRHLTTEVKTSVPMNLSIDQRVPRFVFMLTRADRTVPEAVSLVPVLRGAGVTNAGAKDVGVPSAELVSLFAELRGAGCTTYLEVVSATREQIRRAAQTAITLGADILLGGSDRVSISNELRGSKVAFFPYVGRVVGHPCLLRGSIPEIVDDARKAESEGADGINLLAYRYDGVVESLIEAVVAAVSIPVLCAGSVDSPDRIRTICTSGAWGFTVGTAALDCRFLPGEPLERQLSAILGIAAEG